MHTYTKKMSYSQVTTEGFQVKKQVYEASFLAWHGEKGRGRPNQVIKTPHPLKKRCKMKLVSCLFCNIDQNEWSSWWQPPVLEAVESIVAMANFLQSIIIIIIIQFDEQASIVPNSTITLISMLSFLSKCKGKKKQNKTSLITLPSTTLRGR